MKDWVEMGQREEGIYKAFCLGRNFFSLSFFSITINDIGLRAGDLLR